MAKGQKRTNRETRKPKRDKPKATPAPRSFLDLRPTLGLRGSGGKESAR
jgi:hypothetical protein